MFLVVYYSFFITSAELIRDIFKIRKMIVNVVMKDTVKDIRIQNQIL